MSAPSLDAATTPEGDAGFEALSVGSLVAGKYEVKRVLGSGGNGAVYEAEHTAIGHRVAIKVVHRALADREGILARFAHEARICGSLRHPNVGQVYDVGTLDDGAPYLVMELQEGRSLGDVLDEVALPIAAIIDIARQLLSGLSAVHQAGAVHRDVKPDNLMIVRDRTGDAVVKLVDFGIAKPIGRRTGGRSTTGEGTIVGSPDYMPPEQLRGDDVDARTDLYAVGVVLYESITRRMPFDGGSVSDLVASVMRDSVTPPTALREDCPRELERVVLKALSRNPARRFQTADEMSRALAEVPVPRRGAPEVSLAHISERPRPTADDAHAHRRRTIDSSTLEWVQDYLGGARHKRRRLVWLIALAAAAGALALLGPALLVPTVSVGPGVVRVEEVEPESPVPAVARKQEPEVTFVAPSAPRVAAAPVVLAPPVAPPEEPPRLPAPAARVRPESPSEPQRAPVSLSEPRSARVEASAQPAEPRDPTALLEKAATSFVLGDAEGACDLYRQIVRTWPRQADAWRGLGLAASRLGERAEAVRAFERYLELRPDASDAARVRQRLDELQ